MLVSTLEEFEPTRQRPARVCVLGSTGSVGKAALDVISRNPESLELVSIAAGSNKDEFISQIEKFHPRHAVLANKELGQIEINSDCIVDSGSAALNSLVQQSDVDIVLAAITGVAGLASTVAALKAGKIVALANKESIVCAGSILKQIIDQNGGKIIPVDSEHSALFQSMQGNKRADIERLVLVATGGPFLNTPFEKFANLTPAQALKHPTWKMGAKISIDSATLMNKALEFIEAYWLFGVESDNIEVLVHPQGIVHSLVAYKDGSQIAQLSEPDMRGPIGYALNYPYGRLTNVMKPLDLLSCGKLEFIKLDEKKFPSISMAKECLSSGGNAAMLFNIANEVAVDLFLKEKIKFSEIFLFVAKSIEKYSCSEELTLETIFEQIQSTEMQLTEYAESYTAR